MRIHYAVAGLALMLSIAGCSRTSVGSMDTSLQPTPLQAQPIGSVQAGQLSDPTAGQNLNSSQFPEKPTVDPNATTMASAGDPAAAAGALDVSEAAMTGNWKVANGGATCDMFLTRTNLGSGSRGGTKRCTGELSMLRSWELSGKQIVFKDADGNVIGRVYKTAEKRFDGQTASGQAISLTQ